MICNVKEEGLPAQTVQVTVNDTKGCSKILFLSVHVSICFSNELINPSICPLIKQKEQKVAITRILFLVLLEPN